MQAPVPRSTGETGDLVDANLLEPRPILVFGWPLWRGDAPRSPLLKRLTPAMG
jgi:hypothetical protein